MNRGGLDAMWLAGVGINLPLNKAARQAAVADAEIRSKGGAHALEAIDLQLRYRTQERFTRARTAEKLVDLYDQGIVPAGPDDGGGGDGQLPVGQGAVRLGARGDDRRSTRTAGPASGLVGDHARLRASLDEASLDAHAGHDDGAGRDDGDAGAGPAGVA